VTSGLLGTADNKFAAPPAHSEQYRSGQIDTDLNTVAGEWGVRQKAGSALNRHAHVDEIAAMVAFVGGPESDIPRVTAEPSPGT
jgi:hypothetical protein